MSTADFDISGSPQSDGGYDATNGETLTLTLEASPALDIRSILYSVRKADGGAPALVFSDSGAPNPPTDPCTVTLPVTGTRAYIIRAQANGGKDANGKEVPGYTRERLVVIRNVLGLRKMVISESTQYDDLDGWAGVINDMVDAFSSVALVTSGDPGSVNLLGAAGTVLTTDGSTPGGGWSLIGDANIDPAAVIDVTKLAPGGNNTTLQTNGSGNIVWVAGVGAVLVGPATQGEVNLLGAANTVLTTDSTTPGGAWSLLANANISSSAAIVVTKLANGTANQIIKTNSGGTALEYGLIANANVATAAAIAVTKLGFGTANYVVKTNTGGTALEHGQIVNASVATAAGIVVTKLGYGAANTVVKTNAGATALEHGLLANANIATGAAIAGSKIAPDFVAQNVVTTGYGSFGYINVGTAPFASAGNVRLPNTGAIIGAGTGDVPMIAAAYDCLNVGLGPDSGSYPSELYVGANSSVVAYINSAPRMTIANTLIELQVPTVQFMGAAATTLKMKDDAVGSVYSLTIQGQDSTTATAGDLYLRPGLYSSGSSGTLELRRPTGSAVVAVNTTGLGLWGATPVAQHSSTGETTGFTPNSNGTVYNDSTFTGNVGSKPYTLSDVVKALKNSGIMEA